MFCNTPFYYLEVFENYYSPCCPAWVDKEMQIPVQGNSILEAWRSEKFQKFRASINDGSFKYCNRTCPNFRSETDVSTVRNSKELLPPLRIVRFSFDRGCNLQCPSCRSEKIECNEEKIKDRIQDIQREVGQDLTRIELSGTGDPIYSKALRDWMINYNPEDFPNVRTIHLCTNAQLFTKQFYGKLTKIKPYLKSLSISIDAATKETYEKIRKGGKWEILCKNLDFIVSLPRISDLEFNFVVQKDNFTEMLDFYSFLEQKCEQKKWFRVIYQECIDWRTPGFESRQILKGTDEWKKVQEQLRVLLKHKNKVFTTLEYDESCLIIPKIRLI